MCKFELLASAVVHFATQCTRDDEVRHEISQTVVRRWSIVRETGKP